jgi:hypothetical protein
MSARGRDGGGEAPESMTGEDLVSLLYGELEPEETERAGARVASDQELSERLGEMRRVRELFSQMADEEPPSRLTAQLMAEAARSAPQMRAAAAAEAGFWARFVSWLQPLVQRPALAAACSLLLVAGVASLLYVRKGEELTSTAPTTATTSVDTDTATGELAEPPPPVTAATPADTSGATLEGDAEQASDEPAKREDSARAEKPLSRRRKAASTAPGTGKAYDKAPAKPTLKSGTVYGLSEQEMVPAEEGKVGNQAGPTGGASAPPTQKKAEPPPPPAAEPAPASPTADSKAAPRPDVRELHNRAIDAALDNRCSEVRTLAGQVRATDSTYYGKSFASDQRLKKCLASGSPKAPAKK